MVPGFVLVHGYTGLPADFGQLAENLSEHFGRDAVQSLLLPGHGGLDTPRFEPERFREKIAAAVGNVLREKRPLVLIGHSTGGSLLLSYIMEASLHPSLLVLASVPRRIEGSALESWERHRRDKPPISLNDVARMVLFVNRIGAVQVKVRNRLLVLHGESDRLVPPADARKWLEIGSSETAKCLIVPAAGHDLFAGANGASVADRVSREAKALFSRLL
jgi:alpha-beta hydrolase superfamily lysophospholipase